jgi:uncharacterized protein YegJ (DUF2314 family)
MPSIMRLLVRLLAYLFLLLPILGILLICLGLAKRSMWIATLGVFLASFGLTLWVLRSRRRKRKAKEAKAPMISMVLLLKEPRYLEARILAQIVSSAWGGEYEFRDTPEPPEPSTPNEGSSMLVAGATPIFGIFAPDGFYVLHNRSEPYFEDVEGASASTGEARTQKAIQEHQGWLSVDCVSGLSQETDRHEPYTRIARLIAELAGPDVLAILRPETGQVNVWNDELEDTLRSPEAMKEWATPVQTPVIQVEDDDPRMKAAVEEARRKWPEFLAAFKAKDCEHYAIKTALKDGDRMEHIWVEVDGIEPDFVHGTLGNDPVDLPNFKLGDRIEVSVVEVEDWCFVRGNDPVGLFTTKVLAQVQDSRRQTKP